MYTKLRSGFETGCSCFPSCYLPKDKVENEVLKNGTPANPMPFNGFTNADMASVSHLRGYDDLDKSAICAQEMQQNRGKFQEISERMKLTMDALKQQKS